MGQSPDCHLFYGYVFDGETSAASVLNSDREHEWTEVLLERRGVANPWTYYRESGAEAEHSALPYAQQDAAYQAWKSKTGFGAMVDEWTEQNRAVKAEFNCRIAEYGATGSGYGTAYIYVQAPADGGRWGRGYRNTWDGPTEVDPAALSAYDTVQMDAWLDNFIAALNIDMGEPEWGKAPVGPGWFMVSSYG